MPRITIKTRQKMKLKLLFPLIVALIVTVSCSPIYKTDYRFTTPPSAQGKMCATSCVDKMQMCKANCATQESNCRQIEYLKAENAYLKYVEQQRQDKKPIEKNQSDFTRYSSCSLTLSSCKKECDSAQRICHFKLWR